MPKKTKEPTWEELLDKMDPDTVNPTGFYKQAQESIRTYVKTLETKVGELEDDLEWLIDTIDFNLQESGFAEKALLLAATDVNTLTEMLARRAEKAEAELAALKDELRSKQTWVPEGYVEGLTTDLLQLEAEREEWAAHNVACQRTIDTLVQDRRTYRHLLKATLRELAALKEANAITTASADCMRDLATERLAELAALKAQVAQMHNADCTCPDCHPTYDHDELQDVKP